MARAMASRWFCPSDSEPPRSRSGQSSSPGRLRTKSSAQAARSGGAVCYERCDPDHRTKGYAGAPVHDAVAVCALLRPDLLHFEDWHVTVETQGAFCRGATVGDRRTAPNARVITGIDREGFAELLTEAVRTYG